MADAYVPHSDEVKSNSGARATAEKQEASPDRPEIKLILVFAILVGAILLVMDSTSNWKLSGPARNAVLFIMLSAGVLSGALGLKSLYSKEHIKS